LYEIGDLIGEGQFGKAYFGTQKATGKLCAVKVISKQQFWDDHELQFSFGELREEIDILQHLNHPNLIKYIEALESSGYLYLIMECCKGGELFDRIQAQQHYSEKDAVGVLRQIGEALQYLHHRKIAHCDLKPGLFSTFSHLIHMKTTACSLMKLPNLDWCLSTLVCQSTSQKGAICP